MGSWWGSHVGYTGLLASLVLGWGPAVAGCGGSAEVAPDGSAAPDAAADGPEATGDAAPPADAGSDARPDASAKGFCATRSPAPRFCDDFDDGELDDDWAIETVLNGEPILDTSSATSVPASFAVETLPLGKDDSAHVHLRATVNGAPAGHVVLAFDMMLATATYTKGTIAVATLDVSQNHFFTLYLRDGDLDAPAATLEETDETATTKRNVLSKLPPPFTWTRATIDIDVGGAKASVLWDGEKVLDQAPITAGVASDPTIRVGAVYVYGPADPFEARFDGVTLDF